MMININFIGLREILSYRDMVHKNELCSGKKVLVAGGNGLIGINLIKRLLKEEAVVSSTMHK